MAGPSQPERRIKAVILTPTPDFGRCKLASRMCAALWPVAGEPVLNRLLSSLCDQDIDQAVICSYGDSQKLKDAVRDVKGMEIEFLDEPLPVGNAGCIRDASRGDRESLLLVLHAGTISPPKVSTLIEAHRESKSHLTVFFGPHRQNDRTERLPLEIYVCDPDVVDYMPPQGYFDIKEGLVPEMVRAGRTVGAKVLSPCTSGFRDHESYLSAVTHYLNNTANIAEELSIDLVKSSENLWLAPNAKLAPDVVTHGPVVIMDNSGIESGSVIFGPAVIESGVNVARNTLLDNSVIWSGAAIGPNCRIRRSIIDRTATVPANSVVNEHTVICPNPGKLSLYTRAVYHSLTTIHFAIPARRDGIKSVRKSPTLLHESRSQKQEVQIG